MPQTESGIIACTQAHAGSQEAGGQPRAGKIPKTQRKRKTAPDLATHQVDSTSLADRSQTSSANNSWMLKILRIVEKWYSKPEKGIFRLVSGGIYFEARFYRD